MSPNRKQKFTTVTNVRCESVNVTTIQAIDRALGEQHQFVVTITKGEGTLTPGIKKERNR
jgi:hypothetical protein